MNNDLISRSALIEAIEQGEGFSWDSHGKDDLCVRKKYIDNTPTVELDESVIQEVLNKRCMTAVANEYLVALHCNGTRPQGEWKHPYSTDIACECSNCHLQMPITDYFNFCPNCGADMRKGGAE